VVPSPQCTACPSETGESDRICVGEREGVCVGAGGEFMCVRWGKGGEGAFVRGERGVRV
jgi:hypothetical protein